MHLLKRHTMSSQALRDQQAVNWLTEAGHSWPRLAGQYSQWRLGSLSARRNEWLLRLREWLSSLCIALEACEAVHVSHAALESHRSQTLESADECASRPLAQQTSCAGSIYASACLTQSTRNECFEISVHAVARGTRLGSDLSGNDECARESSETMLGMQQS